MQSQIGASINGDEELGQVAQRCLDLAESHVFVVGPPRSGKSTRLPIVLAALSGKMVICVQPEDWIAWYYAEQTNASIAAGVYNGKRVSVGYCMDEEKMEPHPVPKHDVMYVLYRWLYRMVIETNNNSQDSMLGPIETERLNKKREESRKKLRRKLRELIGFVILDEPSICTKLFEACGPRFRSGDYIDLTLGMIRLCREYVLGPQTPCRVQIPLSALDKALRQLAATHAIIEDDPANDISFQLVRKAHIAPMLELWDRCGLTRRHAYFLGLLESVAADAGIGASNQLLSRMLAVLMVVFDENPILRRSTPTEAPTKEFPELQHSLYLSERDFTGDAWVNAVVWMDTMRRARAAGTDVVSFARQYYKQRRTQVDAIPLEAAEHRLRMLARFLNINDHAQNEMCHGSFIPKIERLNQENRASYSGIIELLWDVYLHAYKYNLVYVMREEGSVKLFDFSSRVWIQHAWRHLAIDMDEQLGLAARRRQKGFYATGTSIEGLSLRSLTVMPLEVVHVLYGGKDEESGAFSIEVHLRLA